MKNEKRQLYKLFLITMVLLNINLIPISRIQAATLNVNHTLKFSNKIKVATVFYPYRDPAGLPSRSSKGLQGIAIDQNNNYYLTYSTGDKTHYGFIYKYDKNGKLIKKSKQLTLGHGQAISFMSDYLYELADIAGQENYTIQKIDPSTLTVVKTWTMPSTVHPNVMAMKDANTAITVSKSGDGYDINIIHLTDDPMATRDWHEKVHISGITGVTPDKPIQGFAIGNGKYYLLTNGYYMTFKPDGTNAKVISLNTTREPEGLVILPNGKLVIQFNKLNEVFMQQ